MGLQVIDQPALTRLKCALDSNCCDDWFRFKQAIHFDYSEAQRAALAFIALRSLEAQSRASVYEHANMESQAGMPIAPLFSAMDEAAFWADLASGEELEAYCLACFNRMPPRRQAEFLDFVQGRMAA